MQLTSITVINILTMFVSQFVCCIISDHTDGTAVQRATNNVDACTQCAYLFLQSVTPWANLHGHFSPFFGHLVREVWIFSGMTHCNTFLPQRCHIHLVYATEILE